MARSHHVVYAFGTALWSEVPVQNSSTFTVAIKKVYADRRI